MARRGRGGRKKEEGVSVEKARHSILGSFYSVPNVRSTRIVTRGGRERGTGVKKKKIVYRAFTNNRARDQLCEQLNPFDHRLGERGGRIKEGDVRLNPLASFIILKLFPSNVLWGGPSGKKGERGGKKKKWLLSLGFVLDASQFSAKTPSSMRKNGGGDPGGRGRERERKKLKGSAGRNSSHRGWVFARHWM